MLPEVPVRQWVLTLPYPLRYRCAYHAKLTSAVLRAFIRSLFAELRRRARRQWDLRPEQCGAVTFIQRFAAELCSASASHATRARGSALNLNVHFHTLALDGVYTYALAQAGPPRFLPLPPPRTDEVARVLAGTARRIARLLEARADGDAEALARDEPLLALLAAASLRTRIATGARRGEAWRRLGDRVEPREAESPDADPDASARVPLTSAPSTSVPHWQSKSSGQCSEHGLEQKPPSHGPVAQSQLSSHGMRTSTASGSRPVAEGTSRLSTVQLRVRILREPGSPTDGQLMRWRCVVIHPGEPRRGPLPVSRRP